MRRADFFQKWSDLHGGYDPSTGSRFVRGWLSLSYAQASALARKGIAPDAVTLTGLLWAVAVPPLVLWAPGGAFGAAALVLVAAVTDGVDGALAVLTGRTSRFGYVLDSVVDRLTEAAWLAGFWLLGGPGWLVVAAGAGGWLHEYVRARATAAGMAELGAVTVGERPTRVIVATIGFVAAGAAGSLVATGPALAATVTVGIWAVLTLVGLVQLIVIVRRALR